MKLVVIRLRSKEVRSSQILTGVQPKPILFQWPTRLADGLGLKELLPCHRSDYTQKLVPPFPLTGEGLSLSATED